MPSLSPPKEKSWQLFFRPDGKALFRPLDVDNGWMVEKDKKNKDHAAYMLHDKLTKYFEGYKGVPAGDVTIGYGGDILWDAFSQLEAGEAPTQGESIKKDWMKKIAEAVVHRHEQEAKPTSTQDKSLIYLGIVAVALALALAAKIAF